MGVYYSLYSPFDFDIHRSRLNFTLFLWPAGNYPILGRNMGNFLASIFPLHLLRQISCENGKDLEMCHFNWKLPKALPIAEYFIFCSPQQQILFLSIFFC